jgi:hypothetical protein
VGFDESPLPLEPVDVPAEPEPRAPAEREGHPHSSPAATFIINGGERAR